MYVIQDSIIQIVIKYSYVSVQIYLSSVESSVQC